MKSKLLFEEIKRISEIMNISPKLIIEAVTFGITPSKASEEFLGKLIGGKSSAEAAEEILAKIRKGEVGIIEKEAAAKAFGELLEKEVYTDAERIFVTKIIDKLFPEFVKNENKKLIGVLRTLIPEAQKSFVGNLKDLTVPAETIADDLSRITGIKVHPENIQFYRNRRSLGNQPIQIPTSVQSKPGKPADKITVDGIPKTEPINYMTPLEVDAAMDKLINSSGDGNIMQGINDYIDNFVSDEVSKGNIKLGKITESEIAGDIKKILNPQAQFTMDVINKAFENKTTAEQRIMAQKIAKQLEDSLPPEIKSKPWFKKTLGGIFSNLDFFSEVGSKFPKLKFLGAVLGVYTIIATIQAIAEFNFREGTDWRGKLENSTWFLKTWVRGGVGDALNIFSTSTPVKSDSSTSTPVKTNSSTSTPVNTNSSTQLPTDTTTIRD